MEEPISFLRYKEQESNLILPEYDNDDDEESVEITNKMQPCNRIYYSKTSIEGSTCFERHTAHHQELQTVFAASGLYTVNIPPRH
jgi:hypothetical protein